MQLTDEGTPGIKYFSKRDWLYSMDHACAEHKKSPESQ
jgi:hypothetical protein